MLNPKATCLALLLLSCAACQVSHRSVSSEGVKLAERKLGDDGKVVFELRPGRESPPRILRIETATLEEASLDLVTSSIDSALAERLGVPAWRGVWVSKVPTASAAAKAGLLPGDILLGFDAVEFTNQKQFEELLPDRLKPGQSVELRVLRPGPPEEVDSSREFSLGFVPESKPVTRSTTSSIQLETSKGVQHLTGAQVATIPADLANEIYGLNESLAVISGVVVGSPAYLSGFRKGDRVLDINGRAISGAADVREILRARAQDLDLEGDEFELPDAAEARPLPELSAGEELRLNVLGPLGSHTSSVAVIEDLDDSTNFHFPILFDYSSDVRSLDWSFLDFIFQFGANYESRYLPSETRKSAQSSKLSLFPLGMFEFESTPTYNEYTFLWLITWRSRG